MALRRSKVISEQEKGFIIEGLKDLLRSHEEVVFALLYGSMVDSAVPEKYGDVDLAIYVKPGYVRLPEFILESRIEAEAFRLLSARRLNFPPVEVSVMNNAPYSFLVNLLKGRYIILKQDEEALTNFIDEVGGKSMANSHFRSESLRELVGD